MHVQEGDEHHRALRYMSAFIRLLDAQSVLDVGCGTGRGVKHFLSQHPGVSVQGIEPVQALIDQAVQTTHIPPHLITKGSGETLPFPDKSFDVVCELAVLHHVRNPNQVVAEMTRVAKKAVFLSDSNRYGAGRLSSRVLKLALNAMRLWPLANFVNTGGRGYSVSAGDGLFYSYSVFDSFTTLSRWGQRIILVPTGAERASTWLHPLLTSQHVLLCAVKDDDY